MTDYTELKRLAEAVAAFPAKVSVSQYPSMQYQKIVAEQEFHAAASPDVVLSMIDEIDRLRTQNRALVEALKDAARSLETVSKLAGRATYGNPPIETFMQHHDEVRGYAASRAGVAFESLAQAEGGV